MRVEDVLGLDVETVGARERRDLHGVGPFAVADGEPDATPFRVGGVAARAERVVVRRVRRVGDDVDVLGGGLATYENVARKVRDPLR